MPRSPRVSLWRSGLWPLLFALGAVSAVVAWWMLQLAKSQPPKVGDGRHVESYGFPLAPLLVDPRPLVAGGIPRDGIPALEEPGTLDAAALPSLGRRFLLPQDPVVGVQLGGQTRAYPLRVLVFHELANDTLGGTPILVVHQPLCGLVAVFSRRLAQRVPSFRVSGLLWNSCGLVYEAGDPSRGLWLPLLGRAVSGPAAAEGLSLTPLPFTLTTWQRWQARHPDTTVVQPDRQHLPQYKRDPYSSYLGSDLLRFPVFPPYPSQAPWPAKSTLLVLWPFTDPLVLPLAGVASEPSGQAREIHVRGHRLRLLPLPRTGLAELDPSEGPLPPALFVFAFAWYASHPEQSLESFRLP